MADEDFLTAALATAGAFAGSVHRRRDGRLLLCAAVGLPPAVRAATAAIPEGKGMAGLAWQRAVPVQTCDLQTDRTGDVQPGARAVAARAAIAVPVFGSDGAVRAVVGFAFAAEGDIDAAQVARLTAVASALPPEPDGDFQKES